MVLNGSTKKKRYQKILIKTLRVENELCVLSDVNIKEYARKAIYLTRILFTSDFSFIQKNIRYISTMCAGVRDAVKVSFKRLLELFLFEYFSMLMRYVNFLRFIYIYTHAYIFVFSFGFALLRVYNVMYIRLHACANNYTCYRNEVTNFPSRNEYSAGCRATSAARLTRA